ncbi:MAG: ribonuclease III domain-containing protein [Heliobacteriaceae bacterium]|nr:ribonuclease III domain-containing protein [Heliobacteriaceae bacterium]MDD4587870.1 ribonuclease III domain-containing protein [Heliobacteriaceae bacterium]
MAAMTEPKDWSRRLPAELPSPPVLAYLGDAAFELYVRRFLLDAGIVKVKDLHQATVGLVCATAQVALLRWLEPRLTPEEKNWVRRGRNADTGRCPKSTDVGTYRLATGLECLAGYWALTAPERLDVIRPYLEEAVG